MRSFVTRALFLKFLLLVPFLCTSLSAQAKPVTACAIRWDAWYTNGPTDPSHFTARGLSPPQWHALAPLHAQFDASGQIVWAPSQATFDAEIRAAHAAHLCWAYLMYGTNNVIDLRDPQMQGLKYHRNSSKRLDVKYSLITTSGLLGRSGHYTEAVDATVALLRDTNYQKVTIKGQSRPLIFLFYSDDNLKALFNNSFSSMKEALDSLRKSSESNGLGNPYIVLLLGDPIRGEIARSNLGADALSEYVAGKRRGDAQTWESFEPSIEADWNAFASASVADVIPTLRSGADIRARCESAPPFDHRFALGYKCSNYVKNPNLDELAKEFHNARAWISKHQGRDPSSVMLVYAWSECDESGNCLMPTIGDPNGVKLQTIAPLLE